MIVILAKIMSNSGLLGAIESVTVQHNIENENVGVLEKSNNTILPKLIDINLSFKPLHEHPIGWSENIFSQPSFPYDAIQYDNFGAPSDVFVGEDNITDDTNQSVIDDESASRSTIYEDYNSAEFKDDFGIYSFEKF
jgi:hypothetical protein